MMAHLVFRSLSGSRVTLSHAKWESCRFFQPGSTPLPALATAPLVLKSSQFVHLFEEGLTESIYAGSPVARINHYEQGKLCQEWAKHILQKQNPESEILDPEPGNCSSGSRRGRHCAPYDFLMDDRKVEVKSSRMFWNSQRNCWVVRFCNIKLAFGRRRQASFDDLYCVIMSPKGLQLVKHDLCTRISTNGHGTEPFGHRVSVNASVQDASWEEALATVQRKLCQEGSCELVVESRFSDPDLRELLSRAHDSAHASRSAYHTCAMRGLSAPKRALRIQQMALEVDTILHPTSHFRLLGKEAAGAVVKRNTSNAPVDWIRDKVGVEIKNAKLVWNKAYKHWICSFCGIKPSCFDELWLAVNSPFDLRFYVCRSTDKLQLGSHGQATEVNGFQLGFAGPHWEEDYVEALLVIEAKMISRGCKLVAAVQWDRPNLKAASDRPCSILPTPPMGKVACHTRLLTSLRHSEVCIARSLSEEKKTLGNHVVSAPLRVRSCMVQSQKLKVLLYASRRSRGWVLELPGRPCDSEYCRFCDA